MKWTWPFVSRRQHEEATASLRADRDRIRGERDQFAKDRDAVTAAARREGTEAGRVIARLTEDLTKLRAKLAASMDVESALAKQIHEMAQPVEPTDAEIDSINRLLSELDSEKRRADALQKRLDDALGLNSAAVTLGEGWQSRREPKMRYDA